MLVFGYWGPMTGLRDRRLVERDREREAVRAAVKDVRAGRSRVLVFEGSAGIGKTRLVSLVGDQVRAAGFEGLVARASELERPFAFGVMRGLLERRVAALKAGERRRVLSGQARMALRPLGMDREPVRTEGDALQAAFNGLFWLCAGLARERPLLLAIDDAHWCDEASLDWLAWVLPRFEGVPVLVVLAYRPSEPGTDAPARIAELTRAESVDVLVPQPLSGPAVGGLLAGALGATPDEAFTDACREATGGNPFLLHELLVELRVAGVTPEGARAGEVGRLGSRRVSEGVLTRVRRIGEDALRLTSSLAVLGESARLADAAALAELEKRRASSLVGELVDAGVLAEGFPLEFAHPLVRAAVYEHLPYAERLAAHARAARLLAETGVRAEAVATHVLIAAPAGDAWVVDVLRRAARDAVVQGSSRDAIGFLRRALLEPPDERLYPAVLAELGIAEHNVGDPTAVEHLSEALSLTNDPQERAFAGLVLARAIWHSGEIADAVALLKSLIAQVGYELGEPLEAELIAIARLDPHTRRTGLRLLAQREAQGLDGAGRLLLADACFESAVAGDTPADEVAHMARRALGDGALLAEEGSENTIYHLAAWVLAQCDRFIEAEEAFQAAIELAQREGSAVGFARALTFRSNLCYRRGSLDEAEADGRQALEHLTPMRASLTVAFLLDVLIDRGELRGADELLEQFGLGGEVPVSILHTILLERRGRLRMAQDKQSEALGDLQLCAERALRWGAGSPAFLAWRSSTALALAQTEDTERAWGLAGEEVARARRFGAARALGVALRVAGLLPVRSRDIGPLEEAARVLQDSGAPLEHARALIDLGAALRRAGQRSAARERLRVGLELAERHGASALARRGRVELRSAGGRPIRLERKGVQALTPAELRVARMAALGMTNRDIAQALFAVPKTIEWHLGQTYRKLGVRSRSELPVVLGEGRSKVQSETGVT